MIDKEQTTETLIERVRRLQQVMAARDVSASLDCAPSAPMAQI